MTMMPLMSDVAQRKLLPHDWLIPDWPAPAKVRALVTSRHKPVGGDALATAVGLVDKLNPYVHFNLAQHVEDDPQQVIANRQLLRQTQIQQPHGTSFCLPSEPFWLNQVHGTRVLEVGQDALSTAPPDADGSYTHQPGQVCTVLTADCLPLLLCDENGSTVAAVHAGWRGLAEGVIESAVEAMRVAPTTLLAWLGPAIGPTAFEVGEEVRDAFCGHDLQATQAFVAYGSGKWRCNLYCLARQRLTALGVTRIFGGDYCTYTDDQRFYSFRRDGVTGRMATLIWIEPTV